MTNMIQVDTTLLEITPEEGIKPEIVKTLIKRHLRDPRILNDIYGKLDRYYRAEHDDILSRKKPVEGDPNNKLINGYPKYITDMFCGYMFGTAIEYTALEGFEEELKVVTDTLKAADVDTHDAELGKDLSVYGDGCELLYFSDDEAPTPKITAVEPFNAFVVYSDTVDHKPLAGFHYFPRYDLDGITKTGYSITVYTDSHIYRYKASSLEDTPALTSGPEPHYFHAVPLIEYWNNEEGMGDFETVLSLVDAYNTLQSDRVNDKQKFVEALLVIFGAAPRIDELNQARKEKGLSPLSVQEALKAGVLVLEDPDSDAKYITKMLNEGETEILSKSITHDIHKFSMTPDLTDEQFSGNSSGVALGFKLLSMEYACKTKDRYYKEGLKKRLAVIINALNSKGLISQIAPQDIQIKMKRDWPTNKLETAQIVQLLDGKVADETLLTMLSFAVEDPLAELEKLRKEREEKADNETKRQKEIFNSGSYGMM